MDSREACPSVLPLVLWGLQMRRERPILVYLFATSGKRERFHQKETVDEEASVQFGTTHVLGLWAARRLRGLVASQKIIKPT